MNKKEIEALKWVGSALRDLTKDHKEAVMCLRWAIEALEK